MKTRFLLSSVSAFLFASTILVISLMTTDMASAGEVNVSDKGFYLGEVKPDHMLYPVLMTMDRFYLEISDPTERIYKQIEYANRRLYYTKELLATGDSEKQEIAHATLTKAAKYILQAGTEVLALTADNQVAREFTLRSLKYHHGQLLELTHQFPDSLRTDLDTLKEQEKIVIMQLEG